MNDSIDYLAISCQYVVALSKLSCPDISLLGPAKIYICGTFYVSTDAGVYDFRQLQLRSAAGSSPKGLSSPTGCC